MGNLIIDSQLCVACGACAEACPFGAIQIEDAAVITDACRLCGSCIDACPTQAISRPPEEEVEDLSQWKGILVFSQQQDGQPHPVTYEMLGKAAELAKVSSEAIYVVAIGSGINLDAYAGYGVKAVYCYDDPCYSSFRSDVYGPAICDCIQQLKPASVLYGATPEARALAPFVAVHFTTGLTADCTALQIKDDGDLLQTRPAFGGDVMADIITHKDRPQMATVRERIFAAAVPEGNDQPTVYQMKPPLLESRIQVLEETKLPKTTDITDAEILVAVGRGIRKKEDIAMFEELASLLGGQIASSRALVEKGWMPIDRQIGLSGKAVSPKLLLTFGISGSVQFQAGIRGAKRIIAINSDADAPIHSVANLSSTQDMYELVPLLLEALKD